MQEEVGSDVDLVTVATSQFSALDVDEIVVTILDTFQRPERCLNLNVPLPMGSPPMETGLQRLLYWGEMPAVMLADMVVLPFTRDSSAITGERPLFLEIPYGKYDHWRISGGEG